VLHYSATGIRLINYNKIIGEKRKKEMKNKRVLQNNSKNRRREKSADMEPICRFHAWKSIMKKREYS